MTYVCTFDGKETGEGCAATYTKLKQLTMDCHYKNRAQAFSLQVSVDVNTL
jgi:hypothetical protein